MKRRQDSQGMMDDVLFEIRQRRWTRAGAVYIMLLLFSVLFMGPFVFGTISSVKDDPIEWPPRLTAEQLRFKNWRGAYAIASQVGESGWFGEMGPNTSFSFDVTYAYPEGKKVTVPDVTIPERRAGYGVDALQLNQVLANDYVKAKSVEELERTEEGGYTIVSYKVTIENPSQYTFSKVPLSIKSPAKVDLVRATLAPGKIERLGMVQNWDNITAGVIPYVFNNYNRVFKENYSKTTGRSLFLTWMFNSFYLCFVRVILIVMIASMAGYALARLDFLGKKALFVGMLFSMMVPAQVTFISNYIVLRDGIFGLTKLFGGGSLLNSFSGLIISGIGSAGAVFIMKQFFEGMPRAIEEAAKIDGANIYQTFFRIMLPLASPALGAVTILNFQGVWNEFFWPMVVITSPADKYPLTIGLNSMRQMYGAGAFDWGPILAGAVISAIPIIILFVVFQRYFVEGMSAGAEKG